MITINDINNSSSPIDIIKLCNELKVKVYYGDLDKENILSCSIINKNKRKIIINKNEKDSVFCRFHIAYALSDILLNSDNKEYCNSRSDEYDLDSDTYDVALQIAMPRKCFLEDYRYIDDRPEYLIKKYGVYYEYLNDRMKLLCDENNYKNGRYM